MLNEWNKTFNYCPSTGNLYYINDCNRIKAGSVAGTLKRNGYVSVMFQRKYYMAHRIVYMLHNNVLLDDSEQIDHINHNRSDNRISNLRKASYEVNSKNRSKQWNNSSGTTGVYFDKQLNSWRSQIYVNKKCIKLGCFKELSDAIFARATADGIYNFHQNHGK